MSQMPIKRKNDNDNKTRNIIVKMSEIETKSITHSSNTNKRNMWKANKSL